MNIHASITDLIGKTPLLRLSNLEKAYGLCANLIAKLEYLNPAGSVKDRVALSMITDAVEKGLLKPGATIIEPTSGNTGIGLAAIAAAKGYKVILTMPDTMSAERRTLLAAYGAKLVLTPGSLGMAGCIEKANELAAEIENSFIPSQFDNPANPKAHTLSTGPEIWEDTDGQVDIFVAGVGTGGTLTGIGSYLKEKDPAVKVVAVEPYDSALLSGREAGPHGLQGIGANFIPSILNRELIDEIIPVKTEQAYELGRALAVTEGILCGISSGAALYAAAELAKREENKGKNIVVLLPDTGDRYLSTDLFA